MSAGMFPGCPHSHSPVVKVSKVIHQIVLSTFLPEFGQVFLHITNDLRCWATRLIQVRSFMMMSFALIHHALGQIHSRQSSLHRLSHPWTCLVTELSLQLPHTRNCWECSNRGANYSWRLRKKTSVIKSWRRWLVRGSTVASLQKEWKNIQNRAFVVVGEEVGFIRTSNSTHLFKSPECAIFEACIARCWGCAESQQWGQGEKPATQVSCGAGCPQFVNGWSVPSLLKRGP